MPPFRKFVESQRLSFHCPSCPDDPLPVFAEHFEEHCASKHNLIPGKQCPWCFGHKSYLDRTCLEKHMADCFNQFLKELPRKWPPPSGEPELCHLEPLCYNVVAQPKCPIAKADLPPGGLTFQSDALNVAISCLRLFLASDADWMHVMVRDAAFHHFCAAMKETPVRMLPFYCSCRGGGSFHRHVILTCSPRGYFAKSVFRKLKCPNKFASIKRQLILSPMELVRTLDCVSREKCHCDFTFQPKVGSVGERQQTKNHFNVGLSLPKSHQLLLAFQFPGGILEYLHNQFSSLDAAALARIAFQASGLWVVKIGDLPGFGGKWVLPVAPNFQPSVSKTEYYLHLPGGDKFYFEEAKGTEDRGEWIQNQIQRGNLLSNIIGDYVYFPTFAQQKGIALLKPFLQVWEKIEDACEKARLELAKVTESNKKLKTSNQSLKRKYALSEKNLKGLQRKHILYLEQENDLLRMENEDFKRRKMTAQTGVEDEG